MSMQITRTGGGALFATDAAERKGRGMPVAAKNMIDAMTGYRRSSMLGDRFTLEYSPQFYDEISDAVRYITFKLRNPEAAQRLRDDAERAVVDRL
jgi:hypothetical protein